jgi:hypothetical protein
LLHAPHIFLNYLVQITFKFIIISYKSLPHPISRVDEIL